MAQILFLTDNTTNACAFYRMSGIMKDLRRKMPNNTFVIAQWNQIDMHWQTVNEFDLIMIQRPFSKGNLELCDFVKKMRVPLWVDYDDNLLCVPPENGAHNIYDDPKVKRSIQKIIALADVVSVTTEDLKQSYLEYNKNIEVIPNAFNDTIFERPILPKRSHVVLWRGTSTHIYDLMCYARAINKATIEFKDKQFIYVGYLPFFLSKNAETGNLFYQKDQDIILYHFNLFKLAPVVVHVPLHDELFNRCKSNIAFIEGTYFGAVCVVPEWWDAPGALKYKDEQSYYEGLRAVLSGEVDTKVQNKIAWEYIMDELVLSKVNVKRLELINSLL